MYLNHHIRRLAVIGSMASGWGWGAADSWSAPSSPLPLTPPRVLSGAASSVTSMAAISPTGQHVYAWVEKPLGHGDPKLFVATDAASPHAMRDSAGVPGTDPETPPKIGFGPRGEIYIAYQVNKVSKPHRDWTALHVIRSTDQGQTWSVPTNTADDGAWGEYRSDDAFHVSQDGSLSAAWLDGRDPKQARLYFTHSADQGVTWAKNVPVDLDAPCDCCRMSLASSANGTLYLAWRKKLAGGVRDIVVARSADHGATWSRPVRVYADEWHVDSCPDAGPSLLAGTDGQLHLAWWTGKEGAAGVKFVSSHDQGATWDAPVTLKVARFSTASHVQLARGAGTTLFAVWDDGTVKTPRIVLATSVDNGVSFGAPTLVSAPDVRASHPVISVSGKSLVVAWNQQAPDTTGQSQVVQRTASW